MPDAFDGAGEEFHGPSLRAAFAILIGTLVTIVVIWLAYSWSLNQPGAPDPNTGNQGAGAAENQPNE